MLIYDPVESMAIIALLIILGLPILAYKIDPEFRRIFRDYE